MTSGQEACGQVEGSSESDNSALEDKDNHISERNGDTTQENISDNEGSESESESDSESNSDIDETDPDESDQEAEQKNLKLVCIEPEDQVQRPCEYCKIQQETQERVTPRKFASGQYWLKLDAEGIYECTSTGLIFEVTTSAVIEYSLLSWTKYAAYIKDPWIIVGPIFDVKCTPLSVLTSIQFPHTLCLKDHSSGITFNVFHFKNNGPEFEHSVDHSSTHIKWNVSSLSPVGPVIEKYDPVYYHGVVILYKVVSDLPSLEFRVYIASNNSSDIKDVSKSVKHSLNKFIKIEKPPCNKLLQGGKKYRLISDPEADITPEEIQFGDHSTLAVKPFFEVRLEQPMELTLTLVDLESDETVWKAKLRESDWTIPIQNNNKLRRITNSTRRRKSSTSLSGDEICNKRLKSHDTSDGIKAKMVLTDQQLMILAKKMGKDWKVIGIQCLRLSVEDIEQIAAKEDDVNMYKCMMLRKWRDSEQNNGTAQRLYECLKCDASHEVLEILRGFLEQT